MRVRICLALAAALAAAVVPAAAQTDEIQVYDGGLAAPGVFNLTLHNNFTPKGIRVPAFPGAVIADKSFNGVSEWALGVTPWFEAGLYLPLYSCGKHTGCGIDGFKLRALFAAPGADARRFVYGVNFEFSTNARRWDATRFTSEVRPIVGYHFDKVDIIVNPILDTAYDGFGNLVFAPAMRVAHTFGSGWAAAVEEYADFGPLRGFHAARDQSHQLYAVVDHAGAWDVEAGIGFGLTSASDALTLKVILARDLKSLRSTRVTPPRRGSGR